MIGPPHGGLDLFYTLPTALGVDWQFEYASLDKLELVPDVHRDHGIRNAILCITPAKGIDLYARLAVAHAWREGVRRFVIVLCDQRAPGREADEVEQELRVLLDAVGDGGASPCIRTAMTRSAGTVTKDMRSAMERLLAECERMFLVEEPRTSHAFVDAPLPAHFAREAEILDAVRPAIRGGTRIEKRLATLEETATLRPDGGGSHYAGWPYRPVGEAWPDCAQCGMRLLSFVQLDMRDMLHRTPPAHHVFVVYRCDRCNDRGAVVRHYDSLGPRVEIEGAELQDSLAVFVPTVLCHMLPTQKSLEHHHADVIAALALLDDWGRLYYWAEQAMGMSSLRIPDHTGGWQSGQWLTNENPCRVCRNDLVLVSTTEWGDWVHSLWACPLHPDVTHFEFHK